MNNSSQQDLYSITLDNSATDTITIDVSGHSGSVYTIDTMVGNITIPMSTTTTDYITINNSSDYNIQYGLDLGEDWETRFPEFRTVEEMCKEYPALEKALENFKTIYEMVKDDYASKIRNEDQ